MPTRTRIALWTVLGALCALGAAASADVGPTFAIRNARIVPVAGPVIEKGTLIIRDGLIEALGSADTIAVPEDAEVIEAEGLTAYPGLISAHTNLLLEDPAAATGQRVGGLAAFPAVSPNGAPGRPAETPPGRRSSWP